MFIVLIGMHAKLNLWGCDDFLSVMIMSYVAERRNNFPPFPSWCPVQPCFYQDLSIDIPVEFQKIVRMAYYFWIGKHHLDTS